MKSAAATLWEVSTIRVKMTREEKLMFGAAAAMAEQHVGPWLRCQALGVLGWRQRRSPWNGRPPTLSQLLVSVHLTPAERRAALAAADVAKQPVSTWLRNCGRLALGLPQRLGLRGARATRSRDVGVVCGRRPTARTLRAAATLGIKAPSKPPGHCPQGHKYTRANTQRSQGTRKCRECARQRGRVSA